ncbi:TetR/AcrR family transcriptional regulator [Streptomyces sp. NPDC004609]|uniref:TetR/AcrR family transcriptional regulator n=1 Tax=Streptomyces sp. NPDC004609 TaxID=3364704 RepID=UPI0036D1992B
MAARRPPNRKALIRVAAAELFLERGYHNVSVADVAEALGITASALYYHYRNKQELLLWAVRDCLDSVDALVREAADLEEALRSLAAFVTRPRSVFAIWEREARNLDGSERDAIREREFEVVAHLVPLLRTARPDLGGPEAELVARAVFGVLGSRSRHRLSLSRRRDQQLMFRMARAAAHCELSAADRPAGNGPAASGSGLRIPRREQLLTAAVRLFDERGYQSVTMADIGEAAGIVASGVYRHFPSKTDLLVTAVNRGGERIRASADQALARARDPREALELLLGAHAAVTSEHRHLDGILTNERDQLPEKERTALRRFQADYQDVWVQALGAVLPGREPTELKISIHAVHAMIYFVVRSRTADQWPDLPRRLTELGMAVLVGSSSP